MKSMLIAVVVIGAAIAGMILYISNETSTSEDRMIGYKR